MAVVTAFKLLANTLNAGLTAYWRATGCTAITIADVLPLLSKITVYEQEYVIGEVKIWDTGSEAIEPNNCAMVRVMVYDDGWIVAWFDEETHVQDTLGMATFIDAQTLAGFGSVCEYSDKYNGCFLKVTSSSPTDSDCPDDTVFCIRETDNVNGRIKVHKDTSTNGYHFNTGHTYGVSILMTSGNLVWWGKNSSSSSSAIPTNLSNRLYRAIYEMWEELRYSSNATDATDTAVTKAFLDDGGVFTDETTDFNDAGANDVELIPATEAVDDAFYYGSSNKFRGLNLNIGTAGVGNTIVWECWDGSAWSSLTVTDNTVGFTVLGENTVTFTPYVGWAKCFVNSSEQYWIRSRVSVAAFTTQPLLTQGWVIIQDSLLYSDSNLGMYSFEDTSANYCLICGKLSYCTSYSQIKDYYFYNTCLLGKLVYKHSISAGSYIYYTNPNRVYVNSKAYLIDHGITNGFIIFNIKNISDTPGIQNVFSVYTKTGAGTLAKSYLSAASVLITS